MISHHEWRTLSKCQKFIIWKWMCQCVCCVLCAVHTKCTPFHSFFISTLSLFFLLESLSFFARFCVLAAFTTSFPNRDQKQRWADKHAHRTHTHTTENKYRTKRVILQFCSIQARTPISHSSNIVIVSCMLWLSLRVCYVQFCLVWTMERWKNRREKSSSGARDLRNNESTAIFFCHFISFYLSIFLRRRVRWQRHSVGSIFSCTLSSLCIAKRVHVCVSVRVWVCLFVSLDMHIDNTHRNRNQFHWRLVDAVHGVWAPEE